MTNMEKDFKEHNQAGWEVGSKPLDSGWDMTPNQNYSDRDLNIKNDFIVNDSEVRIRDKGLSFMRTVVSSSRYSAALNEYIMGVTNLGVAPTIGLPRPKYAGFGKTYIIKDEAGGAATTTITVVSQGEETFDGAANSTITTNYGTRSFYTDGANWFTF